MNILNRYILQRKIYKNIYIMNYLIIDEPPINIFFIAYNIPS